MLFGNGYGPLGGLLRTTSFDSGSLNNIATESGGKFFYINLVAVFLNNIHHVEGNDNRNPHFQQLGGQIQVALDIGSIHQVENNIRFLVNDIIPGDDLFQCVGGEGINARKIGNNDILMAF